MSTCRCCGQKTISAEIATAAASTATHLSVDERLLALCNAAYEDAVRRGSAEVEIAHFVLAIAASEDGAASLAARGAHAADVGRSALAWLQEWEQRGGAGRVRTSSELKALLTRAQSRAAQEAREFASLDDVTFVLVQDGGALWSASFVQRGGEPPLQPSVSSTPERASRAQESAAQINERSAAWREARPASSAATAQASSQQSLLERDFAWVLARKAPAATPAPAASADARMSGVRDGASLGVRSVQSAESREANDRQPLPPAALRARDVLAMSNAQAGRVSAVASGEQESLMRQIATRLENQERLFSQRLDMQQRMLAELAETFARSLRETARVRESQTAGLSFANGALAASAQTSASETRASWGGSQGASNSSRRSSQRLRLRRHSWNSWRRSRRNGRGNEQTLEAFGGGLGGEPAPWEPREPLDTRPSDNGAAEFAPLPSAGEVEDSDGREKRFYLTLDDEIEKAPAIGPRTAGQLNSAGIMTVRDLLLCDPAAAASKMTVRYITAERIALWQAQSRLVCTIPWLRGTHAQLLTGAGYDTIDKIVAADTASLCAAILKFAATRDGQSVLRASPPPGPEWVEKRVEHARLAEPQRAAA